MSSRREVNLGDAVFRWLTGSFASVILLILMIVAAALAFASTDTIRLYGFGFLTGTDWNPVDGHEAFGALPFVYGTLITSFVALLIAVCDDFAPPFPGLSPQFQACELRCRGGSFGLVSDWPGSRAVCGFGGGAPSP